jgi:hypothetical protein
MRTPSLAIAPFAIDDQAQPMLGFSSHQLQKKIRTGRTVGVAYGSPSRAWPPHWQAAQFR